MKGLMRYIVAVVTVALFGCGGSEFNDDGMLFPTSTTDEDRGLEEESSALSPAGASFSCVTQAELHAESSWAEFKDALSSIEEDLEEVTSEMSHIKCRKLNRKLRRIQRELETLIALTQAKGNAKKHREDFAESMNFFNGSILTVAKRHAAVQGKAVEKCGAGAGAPTAHFEGISTYSNIETSAYEPQGIEVTSLDILAETTDAADTKIATPTQRVRNMAMAAMIRLQTFDATLTQSRDGETFQLTRLGHGSEDGEND